MLNNYSTPTSLKSRYNLLNQLSDKLKLKKAEKYSLHDIIQKEKNEIYNMLAKDPNFKESTQKLLPVNKNPEFYNKMFVNEVKKGNYLLNIIEEIRKKKNRKRISFTKKEVNKDDELEILKRKKLKWENEYKLIQSPLIKKNNSFLNKPIKFNESLDKTEEKQNYNDSSRNFKYYKIKPLKNFKHNSKASTIKSQEKKLNNLKNLLFKCEVGINEGENLENDFEKLNKILYEKDKKISSEENTRVNMFKMLEDKKKRRLDESVTFDKYKTMEENKINEFKKELCFKVSDMFAYSNRNEYIKKIKGKFSSKAFDLYLKDLDKINKEISSKRKIEKKNINQLNILLDDFHVGKSLLKKKLNKIKEKHDYIKNNEAECDIDFENMDEENFEKKSKKLRINKSYLKMKEDMTFYSRFKYFF